MFVFSAKFTKRKRRIAGIAAAALAVCVVTGVMVNRVQNPQYAGDDALDAGFFTKAEKVKTAEAREEFLEKAGWDIEDGSEKGRDVVIPDTFDEVYERYNEMQKENGYDLSKYKGKTVRLYTYKVNNHPSGEEGVELDLIVYENKVIGGSVSSARIDGFMHGIKDNLPETDKQTLMQSIIRQDETVPQTETENEDGENNG